MLFAASSFSAAKTCEQSLRILSSAVTEGSRESPSYHRGMSLSVPYSTYSMKRIVTEGGETKKTRISGVIRRMRVGVGEGVGATSTPRPKCYT